MAVRVTADPKMIRERFCQEGEHLAVRRQGHWDFQPEDLTMTDSAERRQEPRLACDSMLGGLARWLRAAGYDTSWHYGIADPELVRMSQTDGRTILSSDGDIFEFTLVRKGLVPALFVPRGMTVQDQLAYVLRELRLPLQDPRCMSCGGELAELTKEEASGRVPPRSLAWHDRFWECLRCRKVFWHGRHWERISKRLREAAS
jgi:uncharacterized protein with PIN domain